MSPQLSTGRVRPSSDAAGVVRAMAQEPRPRLTWYGPDGSRVELSGRVLVNWVAKSAHLLVEEADLGPGSTVSLRLPGSWVEPVLLLTAWYLGADVVPGTAPADVVVGGPGAGPAPAATLHLVVPTTLPGTVTDLPAGATDFGAEVSGQPDDLPPPSRPRPVVASGGGRRVMLGDGTAPEDVVAVWAGGGSVVLHTGLDLDQVARVAVQENVDA